MDRSAEVLCSDHHGDGSLPPGLPQGAMEAGCHLNPNQDQGGDETIGNYRTGKKLLQDRTPTINQKKTIPEVRLYAFSAFSTSETEISDTNTQLQARPTLLRICVSFVTFERAEKRTNGGSRNMCLGVNHFYVTEAGRARRRQRPGAQVNTPDA